MHHADALALIQHPELQSVTAQVWADLGCGAGTFTLALADLLPDGSIVHAIDKSASALRQIPDQFGDVSIQTLQLDFAQAALPLENLDGILMANALHYIRDKRSFIARLSVDLRESGCWLIVEYETSRANPWVPYPIRFADLESLLVETGFSRVEKLGEHPSHYHGSMYAALAQR